MREMGKKGKERFEGELEEFFFKNLAPFQERCRDCGSVGSKEAALGLTGCRWRLDRKSGGYRRSSSATPLRLTNHEICHEMFRNAINGRSELYIQMRDIRFDSGGAFFQPEDQGADGRGRSEEADEEVMTLSFSLLTLQMLEYDAMMFRAMENADDGEYREAAQRHYRPYLFSFVAEIGRKKYEELRELQRKLEGTERPLPEGEGPLPYLWFACTFATEVSAPHVSLTGYTVQSASSIRKIKADLKIIEDEKTPRKKINKILDKYKVRNACVKDDDDFIRALAGRLAPLSSIDAYGIGNGNCVFARGKNSGEGFFFDVGYNYRHKPEKLVPGVRYAYSSAMREICKQDPSAVILSHWDMDHIAGSAVLKKSVFDKDWFAPDCYDARLDAQRLARYLDLKGRLFLAARPSRKKKPAARPSSGPSGRRIGPQINVLSAGAYRLYMGEKASCDSSYPNCEGIVIEYTDIAKGKTVLMMGDVNYASFNKARAASGDPLFADAQIDYLIAPHHGSAHTDFKKITDNGRSKIPGKEAVICCTNNSKTRSGKPSPKPTHKRRHRPDRPNEKHREELKKRFKVYTTEEAVDLKKTSIKITL